ncbi:hypothetical protein V8C86DRAFT_2438933, partial [Haematococcus lacustris]
MILSSIAMPADSAACLTCTEQEPHTPGQAWSGLAFSTGSCVTLPSPRTRKFEASDGVTSNNCNKHRCRRKERAPTGGPPLLGAAGLSGRSQAEQPAQPVTSQDNQQQGPTVPVSTSSRHGSGLGGAALPIHGEPSQAPGPSAMWQLPADQQPWLRTRNPACCWSAAHSPPGHLPQQPPPSASLPDPSHARPPLPSQTSLDPPSRPPPPSPAPPPADPALKCSCRGTPPPPPPPGVRRGGGQGQGAKRNWAGRGQWR